ncbi:hypothetical protein V8F06_004450 [Rhypophila decipiens]
MNDTLGRRLYSTDKRDQVSTIATCLSTAKKLYDLQEKYKDAPVVVVSIGSESNVILASLTQMQMLLLQRKTLADMPAELPGVLDQTISLENTSSFHLERDKAERAAGRLERAAGRCELILAAAPDEGTRGHQDHVGQAARYSPDICSSYTIATLSMVAPSDLEFAFADVVINSQVYRRALAQAQAQTKVTADGGATSTSTAPTVEAPKREREAETTDELLELPPVHSSPFQKRKVTPSQQAQQRSRFGGLPPIHRHNVEGPDAAKKPQQSNLFAHIPRDPIAINGKSHATGQAQQAQQPMGFTDLQKNPRNGTYVQQRVGLRSIHQRSAEDLGSDVSYDPNTPPSEYLRDGFDPWKLTVPVLRRILVTERLLHRTASAEKSELVAMVQDLISKKNKPRLRLDSGFREGISQTSRDENGANTSGIPHDTSETRQDAPHLHMAPPVHNSSSIGPHQAKQASESNDTRLRTPTSPQQPGPPLNMHPHEGDEDRLLAEVVDGGGVTSTIAAAPPEPSNTEGLPQNWEWDHDGKRWFYRYRPTGYAQYNFPQVGDEYRLPTEDNQEEHLDAASPPNTSQGPSTPRTSSAENNASSPSITKGGFKLPLSGEWVYDGSGWGDDDSMSSG